MLMGHTRTDHVADDEAGEAAARDAAFLAVQELHCTRALHFAYKAVKNTEYMQSFRII